MTTLPEIPASMIEHVAGELSITQLDGGATSRWIVNEEQRRVWAAGERFQRRYITKSRRRGVSTALRLEGMLWTLACDNLGHRVRYGIVMHVEDKLVEQFTQMAWWLGPKQLGMSARCLDTSITFPNGSEIFGITAGGKGASRSEGAQRMDYEEYAFYVAGALGEISPSVSLGVKETIATTIDIGAPNGTKARDMWRDDTNAFEKIFFPFELAREYRMPPSGSVPETFGISEQQWEWALEQGFRDRARAAYWLREVLPNKCEGDMVRAFREYPPTPAHMFQASESRWVNTTARVIEPVEVVKVLGEGGAMWTLLVYVKPADTTGKMWIGVDTAKGSGVSRSTVVVVDEDSGRMCACFADASVMGDDHAAVAHKAWSMYSRIDVNNPAKEERPRVRAEDNTTGQIFIQPARRLGLPLDVFNTDEGSQLLCMQAAKRAVERGTLEGPKELAEECDECHRDPLTGKFKGRKDIMMSYGFVASKMTAKAPSAKEERHAEQRIDGRRIIRRLQAQQRQRWH